MLWQKNPQKWSCRHGDLVQRYIVLYNRCTARVHSHLKVWHTIKTISFIKWFFISFTQRYSHYVDMNSLVDLSSWTFALKCSSHENSKHFLRDTVFFQQTNKKVWASRQDRIPLLSVQLKLNQRGNYTRSMKMDIFTESQSFSTSWVNTHFLAQVELSHVMQVFFS